MLPKRYSVIVADRTSGVVHRFTWAVHPTVVLLAAALALPLGWVHQSRLKTAVQIEHLQLRNATLEIENQRYHSVTNTLSSRIAALQLVVSDLRDRSLVDPGTRQAMNRLAEQDRGGAAGSLRAIAQNQPGNTFDLLHDMLNILDSELTSASDGVNQQQALAAATPINLPADGYVSSRYGYREDPITGRRIFHPAIDVSTGYGQPVVATADGTIISAGRSGNYGNLIEIDHSFGRKTRYGHLSRFAITVGEEVRRGQVIGYAGATGRATGSHVHYEVWVNDRAINPLQLGAVTRAQSAD